MAPPGDFAVTYKTNVKALIAELNGAMTQFMAKLMTCFEICV